MPPPQAARPATLEKAAKPQVRPVVFPAPMQRCLPGSRKRPRTIAGRHARDLRRQVGEQIRSARMDAGLSLRQVATGAGINHAFLAQIEDGTREASVSVIAAISEVLGMDLSIRLYPTTGPRIRDHIQARIAEKLLRVAHDRWRRLIEVPVYRPVRGILDAVLHEPEAHIAVATEIHSQIRRLEQQVGWARLKAESLPSADFWRHAEPSPEVSRLLVLRSARGTRELAISFEETLRAAYPAPSGAVHAAIVGEAPWPGAGILWADLDGDEVRLLDRPPRGVELGR